MKYIIDNITYDNQFDVLYVKFKDSSNSYGDEDTDYLVVFKDFDTDEVTGLTVFDFNKLFKKHDNVLNEISKYIDTKKVYDKYVCHI